MAQITVMKNGKRIVEFFKINEDEDEKAEQFRERMHNAAIKKLRDPEVKEFYEVDENKGTCPCGSGIYFENCCSRMVIDGSFKINHRKQK